MREVDKRTRVSRRVFLRGSATALPAAAVAAAGMTIGAEEAWAQSATTLKPHTMATLARMARDIYPHDRLADVYYIKAVSGYDAMAAKDAKLAKVIEDGVAALDAAAQKRLKTTYMMVAWEDDRVALLTAAEKTPLFQKLHGDLLVSLYNNPEVWAKFGYEGASADKGGYINRGFNDIDWLPTA
jgi:hypothetical protein